MREPANDGVPAKPGRLKAYLESAPAPVFIAYASAAAFTTYFCMYAFRKPFAAARFDDETFLDGFLELKSALVISQIIGYALSKYAGIRFCSELSRRWHAPALVLLIAWALLALVLFGAVPGDWKVAAILLNGLPLGMVWGLVVRYLEGRRSSELLLAGLSCSFIVGSGIVKDAGRAMMSGDAAALWASVPLIGAPIARALGEVSEAWMPAVTGLHFFPPFLLAVWLLNQLPAPSVLDMRARMERIPMDGVLRTDFVRRFFFGIVLLCVAYFFLTAYRDFRDNFMVEILDALGYAYAENKTVISRAEIFVALAVLACLAALNTIRNNQRGLLATFFVMLCGVAMLAFGTLGFEAGWISGFWWITLAGLGSYLAYVPYGAVLFDRMMASTAAAGNAVFAIYLLDAIGYTGSIGMLIYKDFAHADVSRLAFFQGFTWFMAGLGTACLAAACVYFNRAGRGHVEEVPELIRRIRP